MVDSIECVANFSEGQNTATISSLKSAICSVRGAHLLDIHSDVYHNRSVFTFVAPPYEAKEAAFRAIQVACERIDMTRHRGVHPRIGAADVIPFVPLTPDQMPICVSIAQELAEQVGLELGIPVYCYGEAAFGRERRHLEQVRKGQYESLREKITIDPARKPDFGPSQLGPAGASAIGARGPLIAFNVYLSNADVKIARTIARKIRESSGGLPSVKALGLIVAGRAQISMNLTDFRNTSISDVIMAIENEAARFNTSIEHSELIGLLPRDALVVDARRFWHLPHLGENQILEARLETISPKTDDLLKRLSSPTTSLAGVSAAAQAGATAAALLIKVANETARLQRYSHRKQEMQLLAESAQALQEQFSTLVESDANIISAFRKKKKLNHGTQNEAQAMIDSPLHCMALAAELLELAYKAALRGNSNAIADSLIAGEMALAVSNAADHASRANLILLQDRASITGIRSKLETLNTSTLRRYLALRALNQG